MYLGLAAVSVWGGEIIVGGNLVVTGCDGGNNVDNGGGDSTLSAVLGACLSLRGVRAREFPSHVCAIVAAVSGGVTLDVYGSVKVTGGNGGSVVGGPDNGGAGGAALVGADSNSIINVRGTQAQLGGPVQNWIAHPLVRV
jgi:hypothetical protein